MINKIKVIIKQTETKRFIYISSIILLAFFSIVLNMAFSAFTNRQENVAANIKINNMSYGITISGIPGTKLTVTENKTTTANLVISSLNNIDSKYELIYKVCSDSTCTGYINKPESLTVEYSSRTIDSITGSITSSGTKQIRIAVTNASATVYYLELGINAGYMHNTLALQNLIITDYNEEDIKIAAIIEGEISTTFPTIKGDYETSVTCTTDGGASNASGSVSWNGTKWVTNITGVDSGRTICNVNFFIPFRNKLLSQGGGTATIEAKGTPDFSVTNGTSGLYAAVDEYGTSYYYRGLKTELNNNVIFGGFQWKIVRINGDGSIRLIYNGSEAQFNSSGTINNTGANTQISSVAWNLTNRNDAKYVGYMYGGANGVASTVRNGTTSTAATYNETSTNIKTILETWYQTNILGKSFENHIVNNLFCNDRQLQSEAGGDVTGPGYGTAETTYYAAYQRLNIMKNPTLKCGLKNDRFTASSDITIGNGLLTYPVGLITADELAMAGLVYGTSTSTNYLRNNQTYWSFSPMRMDKMSSPDLGRISTTGYFSLDSVTNANGVRPTISIKSDVMVTGDGSATTPFKVIT